MTGVEYPGQLQGHSVENPRGRSMRGLLDGTESRLYSPVEFVGGEMGNGRWMRQGDHKAVSVSPPYGQSQWKLFNVVSDPGEANDLAKTIPEKLETLKTAWNQYAADVGVILAGRCYRRYVHSKRLPRVFTSRFHSSGLYKQEFS